MGGRREQARDRYCRFGGGGLFGIGTGVGGGEDGAAGEGGVDCGGGGVEVGSWSGCVCGGGAEGKAWIGDWGGREWGGHFWVDGSRVGGELEGWRGEGFENYLVHVTLLDGTEVSKIPLPILSFMAPSYETTNLSFFGLHTLAFTAFSIHIIHFCHSTFSNSTHSYSTPPSIPHQLFPFKSHTSSTREKPPFLPFHSHQQQYSSTAKKDGSRMAGYLGTL